MQQLKNFSTMMVGRKVGSLCLAALLAFAATLTADPALAGGKHSGSRCKSSKSCGSGLCVRAQTSDKFGSCCQPSDCSGLNAQCGLIDNGCGVEIDCGFCDGSCVDNQCIPATTTTTSSTTTSTTSTSSTTTSTLPATTTTTVTTSTTNPPQNQCTDDIQCESGCCDFVVPGAWQCGQTCCLGCWFMCYNACGCQNFPATCTECMNGCVPANCGCPNY